MTALEFLDMLWTSDQGPVLGYAHLTRPDYLILRQMIETLTASRQQSPP